jgi:hypothetical protein
MMQETASTLRERLGQHIFDAHLTQGAALADDDVATFALQAVLRARETEHREQQGVGDEALNPP